MKRRVAFILLGLVSGAIVNVAVAWGLAAIPPAYPDISDTNSFESHRYWYMSQVTHVGTDRLTWFNATVDFQNAPGLDLSSGFGEPRKVGAPPAWTRIPWQSPPAHDVKHHMQTIVEFASGWPRLSLAALCSLQFDETITVASRSGICMDRNENWDELDVVRILPLRPVWPGFAINTLFYAAVLWMLFAAPFALRRRRRIKRGLCPACAYPVGASAVCTECGAALPLSLALRRINRITTATRGRGVRGEGANGRNRIVRTIMAR